MARQSARRSTLARPAPARPTPCLSPRAVRGRSRGAGHLGQPANFARSRPTAAPAAVRRTGGRRSGFTQRRGASRRRARSSRFSIFYNFHSTALQPPQARRPRSSIQTLVSAREAHYLSDRAPSVQPSVLRTPISKPPQDPRRPTHTVRPAVTLCHPTRHPIVTRMFVPLARPSPPHPDHPDPRPSSYLCCFHTLYVPLYLPISWPHCDLFRIPAGSSFLFSLMEAQPPFPAPSDIYISARSDICTIAPRNAGALAYPASRAFLVPSSHSQSRRIPTHPRPLRAIHSPTQSNSRPEITCVSRDRARAGTHPALALPVVAHMRVCARDSQLLQAFPPSRA